MRIVQRCVLCNEIIEQEDARAAILMFKPPDEIESNQLDAHLRCLQQAAHPAMLERFNPTFFDPRRPGSE
jgi:hypothetical protein